MLIRLIPRVCDESHLTDPERCKELLTYCNANNSQELCTVKLLTHAIANPANFTDASHVAKAAFNAGASTIDIVNSHATQTIQTIAEQTATWHSAIHGIPATAVVETANYALQTVGIIISILGGGMLP